MSKNSKIGTCNLCGVKKKLIKAHLIPKFLFQELYTGFSRRSRYPVKTSTGEYNSKILCAECDNGRFSFFENFACKTLFYPKGTQPTFIEVKRGVYSLKNKVDYRKIDLFFISILWKYSISSQADFNKSILGTYQDYAKQAILNENFDYHKYFVITILHYYDVEDLRFALSKKTRIEGRNFYILIIGFYEVLIKCDKQTMPPDFPYNNYSTDKDILYIDRTFKNSPEEKFFSQGSKAIRRHCISNRKRK